MNDTIKWEEIRTPITHLWEATVYVGRRRYILQVRDWWLGVFWACGIWDGFMTDLSMFATLDDAKIAAERWLLTQGVSE